MLSAGSALRAISSSVRHAVGTDATSPNKSSWSPITRKSLITSPPSAIAQARSAITRPPVMDQQPPPGQRLRQARGQADVVRQRPDQRHRHAT
jgi:hypothetical protein